MSTTYPSRTRSIRFPSPPPRMAVIVHMARGWDNTFFASSTATPAIRMAVSTVSAQVWPARMEKPPPVFRMWYSSTMPGSRGAVSYSARVDTM